MKKDLDFWRARGDEAKALIRNTANRQKLRIMFPDKDRFDQFVNFIERERTMFETGTDIMKGSQTAERVGADPTSPEGLSALRDIGRVAHGDPFAALSLLGRARRGLGLRRQPELNQQIARQLTDPNVPLRIGPGGELQVGPQAPPPVGTPITAYGGGLLPYLSDPGYDSIARGRR